MDFNPLSLPTPEAADGFTLSHQDSEVRQFWVRHGIACRHIGAAIGRVPGLDLRHELLDARRVQGHASQSRGAATTAD